MDARAATRFAGRRWESHVGRKSGDLDAQPWRPRSDQCGRARGGSSRGCCTGWRGGPVHPGSPGLGDPCFPPAGNGGYDVSHYSLRLRYEPATRHLDGTATIRATATQNLSRFDLDLRGFCISRLLVDGWTASFTRQGQELVITPPAGLPAGKGFTVVVGYTGTPTVVTDPDESIEGWVPTDDGAFVVGEPQGSPGWYPVNHNPQDKATYTFRVTVPKELTVMANGVLVSRTSAGGRDLDHFFRVWLYQPEKPTSW